MKTNGLLSKIIKRAKNIFQLKTEKAELVKQVIGDLIPKHEIKLYHNPPCFGLQKDHEKKRRAIRRQQKLSRRINRKAA